MIKPNPSEFPEFYKRYIEEVIEKDILEYLSEQRNNAASFFEDIGEEKSKFRYAENKWSIKEILGHISDAERIFAVRALQFAREEKQKLPGFNEDDYVESSNFNQLTLFQLIEDFKVMRDSNLLLFKTFDEEIFSKKGIADGTEFSVASILFIMAGHIEHHIKVIKERYL